MRLREKNSAQLGFLKNVAEEEHDEMEATIDEDSSQDFNSEIKKPNPRSRKKQGSTRSHTIIKKPELFQLVLGTLERADVFDASSLKALRLCSKSMKLLVDNCKVLTRFSFRRTRRNYEEFSKFLMHSDALQHLQSLTLYGKMDLGNASRFIMASPPGLKNLYLEKVGNAVEVILCGNYPHLTSLKLDHVPRNCDVFSILKEGSRSWPLVELSLGKGGGNYPSFTRALSQFPDLKKLELMQPYFYGDAADAADLQSSLLHLEDLSIISYESTSGMHAHFDKLGLFTANGATLPSIRKFKCSSTDESLSCLEDCPWLKNVIDLSLQAYATDGNILDAILMNLNGGLVESLDMQGYNAEPATFSRIELPCLKEMLFRACFRGGQDILESMAASGGFPLLESLTVGIPSDHDALKLTNPGSVAAFAAAHPRLKNISISNFRCNAAALQQFSFLLSPQLEELEFKYISTGVGNLVAALLAGAKKIDDDGNMSLDETENATWPKLRVLRFPDSYGPFTHKLYKDILALAPLCPNLRHLVMSIRWQEHGFPSLEEVEVMMNDAIEIDAWPALEQVYLWFAFDERKEMLQRAWPRAEISGGLYS